MQRMSWMKQDCLTPSSLPLAAREVPNSDPKLSCYFALLLVCLSFLCLMESISLIYIFLGNWIILLIFHTHTQNVSNFIIFGFLCLCGYSYYQFGLFMFHPFLDYSKLHIQLEDNVYRGRRLNDIKQKYVFFFPSKFSISIQLHNFPFPYSNSIFKEQNVKGQKEPQEYYKCWAEKGFLPVPGHTGSK